MNNMMIDFIRTQNLKKLRHDILEHNDRMNSGKVTYHRSLPTIFQIGWRERACRSFEVVQNLLEGIDY